MVANRDEALRALAIAQRHLDNANYPAAIRFANKSIALEDTPQARTLVQRAQQLEQGAAPGGGAGTSSSSSSPPSASTSATSPGPSSASTTQRTSASTRPTPSDAPAASSAKQYTSDQLAVVRRVRACRATSYYEILELEKSCSDGQVKKAYRKLALSLHPDKNLAPGAEEAFKMVSKAFQVLSDSNKRAIFDQTGGDPDSRGGGGGGPSSGGGGGFARSPYAGAGFGGGGDDISPEDLFRAFFGGGGGAFGGGPFGGGGRGGFQTFGGGPFGGTTFQFYGPGGARMGGMPRQQGPGRRQGQGAPSSSSSPWVQLAPLLLFFALSLLSQLPSWLSSASIGGLGAAPDPSFAFEPRAKHALERETASGTRYFVDVDEWSQHPLFDELVRENGERVEREMQESAAAAEGAVGAPQPGSKKWKRDLAERLGVARREGAGATAAPVDPFSSSSSPDAPADAPPPTPPLRTPRSLARFEHRVNDAWVSRLQNLCRMELNRRSDALERARGFLGIGTDHARIKELLDAKLPNCEALSKIPGYRVQY